MLEKAEATLNVLVTPEMANFNGNMHGGELLKILDKAAYICASKYSGHYCVTLSVDKVNFKESIKIEGVTDLTCKSKLYRQDFNGNRHKSDSGRYKK